MLHVRVVLTGFLARGAPSSRLALARRDGPGSDGFYTWSSCFLAWGWMLHGRVIGLRSRSPPGVSWPAANRSANRKIPLPGFSLQERPGPLGPPSCPARHDSSGNPLECPRVRFRPESVEYLATLDAATKGVNPFERVSETLQLIERLVENPFTRVSETLQLPT